MLEFYLDPSLFSYFRCVPDNVQCKIAIWADDTHHMTNDLTCSNKLSILQQASELQFDLKNQNWWKIFLFFIRYFLILKCQDLVLKVIYSSWHIRSCYPELFSKTFVLKIWKSLKISLKFSYEIKFFQIPSLQSVSVFCVRKWCTHSEI